MTQDLENTLIYDLCIVGGGYAGVNALHAALDYLSPESRVLLVDMNDGFGGQWRQQYDFVRLHQPYRHFTAGDVPWKLDRPRDYLASKPEVVAHLSSIASMASNHAKLETRFGCRFTNATEDEDGVTVFFRAVDDQLDSNQEDERIRARKLILARGFEIQILKPLTFSCTTIESLSVVDPKVQELPYLDPPRSVVLVGGGKTAMDCAYHLITQSQGKLPITMLTGRGSWFTVRETIFPAGWRRLLFGASRVFSDWFIWIVTRYNGDNAKEVYQTLADKDFLHSPTPNPENFTFGLLGKHESATIRQGLKESIPGHLRDIVTREDGTCAMTIVSKGTVTTIPISDDTVVINCTRHLRDNEKRPIVSKGGAICAPQKFLIFTGPSAFVGTHLFYLGRLSAIWRRFRWTSFESEPRENLGLNLTTLYISNLMEVIYALPLRVLIRLYADFNRWFPWYRQVPALLNLIRYRSRLRKIGDTILKQRYPDEVEQSMKCPPSNQ